MQKYRKCVILSASTLNSPPKQFRSDVTFVLTVSGEISKNVQVESWKCKNIYIFVKSNVSIL